MKKQLTVAVTAGLLALSAAVPAFAQVCGPGTMIEFDANAFAWESNYNQATLTSGPGSNLTVVGIISLWCTPFADLNANDPNTEYTFLFSNLVTAAGTQVTLNGPTTNYDTDYGSGQFVIYAGSPRNAPTAATMPPNPPNATVPANFIDGPIILLGSLNGFNTHVSRTGSQTNGSFRTNYTFTGPGGGQYYARVAGTGAGLIQGNWCVVPASSGGCVPQGYSAHPNGKFDQPPTASRQSTWGTLKQLYR